MTRDVDTLVLYLFVVLVIAAIGTTAVPILYSFSPWRSKKIGRLFMLQAISFALALDLTVLFQFWKPKDILWEFWIDAIVFTMIAVSTSALAWLSWRVNHPKGKRRRPLMLFSENVYKWVKFVAMVFLPGLGTLYFTISSIWDLPYAEAINGTILAVDTFLGLLLGISTKTYESSSESYNGTMVVRNDPEEGLTMRIASFNPQDLISNERLTFKVKQE